MKTIINVGVGVNSTAILALIKSGELVYEDAYAVFSDTGAEKKETYEYLEFLKTVSPLPIRVVSATNEKDGNLYEYCKKNGILPQRFMRWCTDRWKRKPLERFQREIVGGSDDWIRVIGIAYDERRRASRWENDIHADFPLINMKMDRADCIQKIAEVGWPIPVKSGCWFCPFAPLEEFVRLKQTDRERYDDLVAMEQVCLTKAKHIKGWYNDSYPLDRLLARKYPITCEGQQMICINCFDGA